MRISNKLKLGFLLLALSVPMWPAEMVLAADDERRAPPQARTSGTLSAPVMRAITQIQEMMQPEDEDDEPDLVRAKEELDELYERRFERMNNFEKQTILNFYTNYYLTTENYPEAINTFRQILQIEDLREDNRMRTLRSLGQLEAAEENWQESIDAYTQWRELSPEEDSIVFRGLSYAHYQQEEFGQAAPYWISRLEMLLEEGEELRRDDYAYLNGIYFNLEDYDSALELTKTMVMLFDNQSDWMNLSAIYSSLDRESERLQLMNVAYLKGYVDDQNRYLNLGQSLGGIDVSYNGAKIIQEGIDRGIVENTAQNMRVLTQMHLLASEYANALPSAREAAELDETGDGYDTLGYIHYVMFDYEEAAEAFQDAIDKGDLGNRSDVLLFLARSLYELDRFDEASTAARESGEAGDQGDQESADNYLKFIQGNQTRFNALAQGKQDAIDFYESYPSLVD